jgi:hypothetical protein
MIPMAEAFDVGHHAAELLASVWNLSRSLAFFDHVELVYGVCVSHLPVLKGVVLVEVGRGDVRHGRVLVLRPGTWKAFFFGHGLLLPQQQVYYSHPRTCGPAPRN